MNTSYCCVIEAYTHSSHSEFKISWQNRVKRKAQLPQLQKLRRALIILFLGIAEVLLRIRNWLRINCAALSFFFFFFG